MAYIANVHAPEGHPFEAQVLENHLGLLSGDDHICEGFLGWIEKDAGTGGELQACKPRFCFLVEGGKESARHLRIDHLQSRPVQIIEALDREVEVDEMPIA